MLQKNSQDMRLGLNHGLQNSPRGSGVEVNLSGHWPNCFFTLQILIRNLTTAFHKIVCRSPLFVQKQTHPSKVLHSISSTCLFLFI